MQTSPFSYHELHTNNTKTTHNKKKLFKTFNFHFHKLLFIITLYKIKGVLQGHKTPPNILTKRKLLKKLPKTYPPQDSPNNQKEQNHKKTKSHGSPCDSTINHTKQHHMVPHVIPPLITQNNITWFPM